MSADQALLPDERIGSGYEERHDERLEIAAWIVARVALLPDERIAQWVLAIASS